MKEVIAETNVVMTGPDENAKTVHIRIGRPYAISAEEAACPVSMDGFLGDLADIRGLDTFQALVLAVRFVKRLLAELEARGFQFDNQGGQRFLGALGPPKGDG